MTYVVYHQKQKSKHFCALNHGTRIARKTQVSQALDGAKLHPHRKGKVWDQFQRWASAPHGQQVPPGCRCRANGPVCIPLVLQWKDSAPSPKRIEIVGLARCHMTHMLNQNKRAHTKSETGRVILTQGDKPSRDHKDSISWQAQHRP